jgi:hypothetical protein
MITQKKRRGPLPTGKGHMLGVRVQPPQLKTLDAWIEAQPDPKPSRPEAIRQLLDKALQGGVSAPELEDRITEVKQRLAVPDVEEVASPAKGMEILRRGLAENELRTLRQKRVRTKPSKRPKS